MGIRTTNKHNIHTSYFDRFSRSTKRRRAIIGGGDDIPTRSSFEFVTSGDITNFQEGYEYTIGILCPTGTYANGTTLYYTINTVSGLAFNNSDLRLNNYQSSFTVTNDMGIISLDITDDGSAENSVIKIEIRTASTSGTIVAESGNYTIIDTKSEILYYSSGTYSFVAPADAATHGVDAVCVGGGGGGDNAGGGGGGLGWKNGIPVGNGSSYTVVVGSGGGTGGGPHGGDSYFVSTGEVRGRGGNSASGSSSGSGGSYNGSGGGSGGNGSPGPAWGGGGGGAGGYSGNGGNAGNQQGSSGNGGAGGGGASNGPADPPGNNRRKGGAGGGVGLYGQGPNGAGAPYDPIGGYAGNGGSFYDGSAYGIPSYQTGGRGGSDGGVHQGGNGGTYGGGGGGANSTGYGGAGGAGGVRLMWGPNRSFPNTNTGVM